MKDVATLVGTRIAGRPSYTPAHILAGTDKVRSAKCEFNVFKNRGTKKLVYKITAWGGMADAIARGGAVGKEITITAEIIPFEGRTWMPMPDGSHQFVTKPDGTPLMQWKTGYTIMEMQFHGDSAKCKANEIAQGLRPLNWDRPGTPDHTAWLQICANRNAAQYVANAPTFEYADVNMKNLPQGATLAPPRVAANAAQPQYVAPAATPAPVVVNGVNMGYQMPAAAPVVAQNPALPTHDANGQSIQYAANPAAVAQAMPAAQPVAPAAVNTGYAQPIAAAPVAGGYSPVVM